MRDAKTRSAQRKSLLNEERRRAILELMQRDRRVLVADLAREFHTSEVTIRKDLEALHLRGMIQRTHGGALPTHDGALEDPSLREKERLHRKEKLRIAAAAAELVSEGQVVILDSGTTTIEIARALRNRQNLTVITNGVTPGEGSNHTTSRPETDRLCCRSPGCGTSGKTLRQTNRCSRAQRSSR